MILDCLIVRGNPVDNVTYTTLLGQQQAEFWRISLQVKAGGGLPRKTSWPALRERAQEDRVHQKPNLSVNGMAKFAWADNARQNF